MPEPPSFSVLNALKGISLLVVFVGDIQRPDIRTVAPLPVSLDNGTSPRALEQFKVVRDMVLEMWKSDYFRQF